MHTHACIHLCSHSIIALLPYVFFLFCLLTIITSRQHTRTHSLSKQSASQSNTLPRQVNSPLAILHLATSNSQSAVLAKSMQQSCHRYVFFLFHLLMFFVCIVPAPAYTYARTRRLPPLLGMFFYSSFRLVTIITSPPYAHPPCIYHAAQPSASPHTLALHCLTLLQVCFSLFR